MSETRKNFDSAYGNTPPAWDIGEPQPALLALLDEFPPLGPALEVGCGTGELALALARRGLTVVGVDLAEPAIAQAQAKAALLPENIKPLVEFRVGDALHPTSLQRSFLTVADSGFFHLFGQAERDQFAEELAATLLDGGRYYLLGFAFDSPIPSAPRKVSVEDIRDRFTAERGWRILALRPAQFKIRLGPGTVPAIAACIERVQNQ